MKNIKIATLSLLLIFGTMTTACNRTTKIEREVEVGPNGSVSQQTTVDKEISTGINTGDVKVETSVDVP